METKTIAKRGLGFIIIAAIIFFLICLAEQDEFINFVLKVIGMALAIAGTIILLIWCFKK